MSNQLQQMQVEITRRMRELGAGPDDPRLAPLVAQARALMQQSMATALAAVMPDGRAIGARSQAAADGEDGDQPALPEAPLADALRTLLDAYLARARTGAIALAGGPALTSCDEGRALLALGAANRASIAMHAYTRWCARRFGGQDGGGLRRVVSDLLRAKLDLTGEQMHGLIGAASRSGFASTTYTPNQAVASAIKRHVETRGLDPVLHDALSQLRRAMAQAFAEGNAEGRQLLLTIDALLAMPQGESAPDDAPRFVAKPDAWGKALTQRLAELQSDIRGRVNALLTLAAKGGAAAKPAKGWIKEAAQELARDDRARLGAVLLDLIVAHEPGTGLSSENQNTLRGLVWLAAIAEPEGVAPRLEAYAQACLTFSSAHFAYLSLVLGNATIHAFTLLPGTAGVASLSRLKRRFKRPGEVKTVEKALASLAQARGLSAGELEEIGLPDFGFDRGGTLEIPVGPVVGVLSIDESGALATHWRGAGGERLKAPPAAVKDGHAPALKAFKARAKEIEETLRAQRLRLEGLYLSDRVLTADLWRERYLEEPLVAGVARRLIWSFAIGGRWVAALPHGEGLSDASGARLEVAPATRVRLWHPMQSEPAEVLAWRRRLHSLWVTQPFKQAHREIYVLTPAERETEVYSKRFAGHVVDQHRFRALCQARRWKCPAFGMWDSGNGRPMRQLADRKLQVELWVDPIEESMDAEGIQFQHLSTDQVRFATPDGTPVPLAAVDPVVFSELMRDADLFVGVAGIATDPTWSDWGEAFGGYWHRAAFGALSESGQTRHAVLLDLLPGLAIAERCRLEERALVVEGKLRTYRIHLGSGNVQMEPNSQYLCLVQDRQAAGGHVRLPFEGDNMLSLILSKAFMLVDDDAITDPALRAQIAPQPPQA